MSETEHLRLKLRGDILAALGMLARRDRALLKGALDVCERSVVHRFAHYLTSIVESGNDPFYDGMNVDCEYNRLKEGKAIDAKRLGGELVYPDVIIHDRDGRTKNFCVLEFKKDGREIWAGSGKLVKVDEEKLMKFTNPELCSFYYDFGVYVVLNRKGPNSDSPYVSMTWFHKGKRFAPNDECVPLILKVPTHKTDSGEGRGQSVAANG